jgi:hypothetical protein
VSNKFICFLLIEFSLADPMQYNLSHYFGRFQLINVPTAGAQVFLMDYPPEELAVTHHAGPVRLHPGPTA